MGYLAYHQLGAPPACLLDHSYIMSAYFRTFLDPTNHNVSICTVLNVSKNCHFLNPFTRLFCWRNKWMVPVLNCPSSNTYRHFTNIPWMNEKKESQFFRPNIHKFFCKFLKKKTHLQNADYGHHSTDQKWIYNFLYLFTEWPGV